MPLPEPTAIDLSFGAQASVLAALPARLLAASRSSARLAVRSTAVNATAFDRFAYLALRWGMLAPCTVDGKPPKLGLLVHVEEAYTQCPKALIRSDLWNPEKHVDRSELPSPGEILLSVGKADVDPAEYDRERAERYARGEGLY